jgi:hypothetical protein
MVGWVRRQGLLDVLRLQFQTQSDLVATGSALHGHYCTAAVGGYRRRWPAGRMPGRVRPARGGLPGLLVDYGAGFLGDGDKESFARLMAAGTSRTLTMVGGWLDSAAVSMGVMSWNSMNPP